MNLAISNSGNLTRQWSCLAAGTTGLTRAEGISAQGLPLAPARIGARDVSHVPAR